MKIKKFAVVQGMSFRPSDRLTIGILFRNYYSGYTTFLRARNPVPVQKQPMKTGFWKFHIRSGQASLISGGCDLQHFPWAKSTLQCVTPSWAMKQEIKVRIYAFRKTYVDASIITG